MSRIEIPGARRLKQHLGAVVGSLGGFALGVSLGWNSRAEETLRNVLEATEIEIGLVAGLLSAGACLGAILVPFALKQVGAIACIILATPLLLLGWALICFGHREVSLLISGRLICGIASGAFCVLTPIYIAEIADKHNRGRLLMVLQLLVNCGIWYSLVCTLMCLVVVMAKLLPESPVHHLEKSEDAKAEESLRWYRDDSQNLGEELAELKWLVSHSKEVSLEALKNRRVFRAFVVCFLAIVGQQLSGVNTITFHALTLFSMGGSGELTASEATLVLASVQVISCLLGIYLVNLLGRRILISASSALMGLFLVLLGWFHEKRDEDPEYDDIYFWMPPTWTILFLGSFNVGLGPISWALIGDVFPRRIRTPAAACVVFLSWLLSLLNTLSFGQMLRQLGIARTTWLSAGFCWISAILCGILVEDNRGRSLVDVEMDLVVAEEPRVEET
ncbi:hypothetical protein KM043_001271 [Ampulex compressa]|nr:hypothetical protein KM043_001271 [Ampulex compressa]